MATPKDMGAPRNQSAVLSPLQIAQYAFAAGFRGQSLVDAVAVAMAESRGNLKAHNTNAGTGDNSYSLWQINMLGKLGPGRLKQFGIKSANELFDPATNARAAFSVSGGGKNFAPWTTYKKGLHKPYLSDARAAASAVAGGDTGGGGSYDGSVGDSDPAGEVIEEEDRTTLDYQMASFDSVLAKLGMDGGV